MTISGAFSVRTLNPGDVFLCQHHWRRVVRVRAVSRLYLIGEIWHTEPAIELLHGQVSTPGGLELVTLPDTARVTVGIL